MFSLPLLSVFMASYFLETVKPNGQLVTEWNFWCSSLIWCKSCGQSGAVHLAVCFRGRAERPSDASYAGGVQPHGGLRAAAGWAHHQPVLLGLAHSREEEPAVSGTQQHCALYRPFTHQSRLHDLQRWLQGPLLVPPHHHRLTHSQLPCSCPAFSSSPAYHFSLRTKLGGSCVSMTSAFCLLIYGVLHFII